MDEASLREAIVEACRGRVLSSGALWALHHVGVPRALGEPLVVIAARVGLSPAVCRERLEAARVELEGGEVSVSDEAGSGVPVWAVAA